MAGRIYEAHDCLRYAPSLVPVPVLRIDLRDILGEVSLSGEFVIDTGFEGDVMVPWEDFRPFTSGELPEELWRTYLTASGSTVRMRSARALAAVGDVVEEVIVETPILGEGRRLVGRGLLIKLKIALDGPKSISCLLREVNCSY